MLAKYRRIGVTVGAKVLLAGTLAIALLAGTLVVSTSTRANDNDEKGATREYSYATRGVWEIPGIKLLLDESNLGGKELEIAELTLPAGTIAGAHQHGSVEILYVLEGTLGHEVNGQLHMLTPGMIGVVRPGDTVRHIVPKEAAARFLAIWAPAGEAKRLFGAIKGTPIKQD